MLLLRILTGFIFGLWCIFSWCPYNNVFTLMEEERKFEGKVGASSISNQWEMSFAYLQRCQMIQLHEMSMNTVSVFTMLST